VSSFAGNGSGGCTDGAGTLANFNCPQGIVIDKEGNLFVTDGGNHRIRKITPQGNVSTLAGSSQGCSDGLHSQAQFNWPTGIAIDAVGNLLVTDSNHKIRKVSPQGMVSTLAGNSAGNVDGECSKALFNHPRGITLNSKGNIIVGDYNNHSVRKIT